MEALKEAPVQYSIESVKTNEISDGSATPALETGICYASNGVAETTTRVETSDAEYSHLASVAENIQVQEDNRDSHTNEVFLEVAPGEPVPDGAINQVVEQEILAAMETNAAVESLLGAATHTDVITGETVAPSEAVLCNEVTVESSVSIIDSLDSTNDKVTLRTEVLVEKSEDDINDADGTSGAECENTNNILNDLSHGIELSEALRSSDTADHVENNNASVKEEVFNKEELLDILEGNDNFNELDKKKIEAEIALKQLSRLSKTRKRAQKPIKSSPKTPRKKRSRKSDTSESENVAESPEKENKDDSLNNGEEVEQEENSEKAEVKSNDSIVHTLVKDWDDDEPAEEEDQVSQLMEQSEKLLQTTNQQVNTKETAATPSKPSKRKSSDVPAVETPIKDQNKSGDETQPQRGRQGRVIKKKVPFDPDNPDTFTKNKEKEHKVAKHKELQIGKEPPVKEPQTEKEQPPPKKPKSEQTPQRASSKSPVGAKQQWKKPSAKNGNKNNKRLSEVDKLLMDEGAVNMIYQLTPEAPKGKKNMRTKAEFIKKVQSSTPDGKEMKFRERKKETKSEEREAKKILGGKSSRSSMSGSIKSPSANEDFETHSADDSIIYRRHSSSSYSSACMSPRRLSDVETGASQTVRPALPNHKTKIECAQESPETEIPAEAFMSDTSANNSNSDIINKDDCLSIKEKLNTKLSLALNKKKRESTPKTEKPMKQKRISKTLTAEKVSPGKIENIDKFKQLSVHVEQRLIEICIRKTGSGYSFEMFKELEQALQVVDSKKDVSVTLLTSECGTLCSSLDLRPLLGDNMEMRTNYAHSIAESVRSLLCAVEKHSKLIVSGVWEACTGVGLALAALSDVCLATDHAYFSVTTAPPLPGAAVLTTRSSRLSQTLINDLIVFGRNVPTAEALQGGLVSRCVPGTGAGLLRAVAKDLASQPAQNILLKKQLLTLNRSKESMTTFLTGLEKERDLLVEYWTSVEGQDKLREVYNP